MTWHYIRVIWRWHHTASAGHTSLSSRSCDPTDHRSPVSPVPRRYSCTTTYKYHQQSQIIEDIVEPSTLSEKLISKQSC